MTADIKTSLYAEQLKHKYRKLFLLPAALFAFQFLWCLWNADSLDAKDLSQGYLSIFYLFPMLNSLMYPIFIAVFSNRICDMEIKGDTLKLLYTLEEKNTFYNCKYLIGLKYLAIASVLPVFIIFITGKMYGFTDTLYPHMLLQLTLSTFAVSTVLLSIQQMLSLLSSNQILPLIVGVAGSFLSLFSMFFPPVFARLVIWGYYGIFSFININWEKTTRTVTYFEISFPWTELFLFSLFSIALYFICRAIVFKKEV